MSAYRNAIDLTIDTIARRAKSYRNLVVAVVLTGLCSIVLALAAWSVSPLSGLILLIPVCSFFFHMDGRQLDRWRSVLLAEWARGGIEFRYFRDVVSVNPVLPKETLQGMLATLPAAGDTVTDQGISSSTREAIAAFVTYFHACQTDAMAFRTVGSAIAGGSLVAAATSWNWLPFLGMATLVLIPLAQKYVKERRLKAARELIVNAQKKTSFNQEQYTLIIKNLNLDSISAAERDSFLMVADSN